MKVMALFSTSFLAKCLRVGEDGPGRGHLCHIDTFLVFSLFGLVTARYGLFVILCPVLCLIVFSGKGGFRGGSRSSGWGEGSVDSPL